MLRSVKLIICALMAGGLGSTITPAEATTAVVFGNIDSAITSFNSTVTGAGGVVSADIVHSFSGTTYSGAGYTVTSPVSGRSLSANPYTIYNSSPSRTLSGSAFDISPSGPGAGHGDGNGIDSGIQFNFTNGVNAIGFEVGDWATCCQESDLYISFDGGSPIQVGKSTTLGDQYLTNGGAGVFVSAFDDSGKFSTVNFWGDGYGEFLVAGGTIRTSAIKTGGLPVPEPASIALLAVGLLGGGLIRRKVC